MGKASRRKRERQQITSDPEARSVTLEMPAALIRRLWAIARVTGRQQPPPGFAVRATPYLVTAVADHTDFVLLDVQDGRGVWRLPVDGRLWADLERSLHSDESELLAAVAGFQQAISGVRPLWAGSPGFDLLWQTAARMHVPDDTSHADVIAAFKSESTAEAIRDRLAAIDDQRDHIDAVLKIARAKGDYLADQVALLKTTVAGLFPGRLAEIHEDDPEDDHDSRPLDERHLQGWMFTGQRVRQLLSSAVPIVFDAAAVPEPEMLSHAQLQVPFSPCVLDFAGSIGVPITPALAGFKGGADVWTSLQAVVIERTDTTTVLWPLVKLLNDEAADDDQDQRLLMPGCVIVGVPPEPYPGMTETSSETGCTVRAWISGSDQTAGSYGALWLMLPVMQAMSALSLLEAVNVDISPRSERQFRRDAERSGGHVALTVKVTPSGGASTAATASTRNWSHRWMVRGHWKHHPADGPIGRRHPERVVEDPQRGLVVKVWCPPYVKGPEDKPVLIKQRRVGV